MGEARILLDERESTPEETRMGKPENQRMSQRSERRIDNGDDKTRGGA
jgi:hypothetical protein